MVGVGVRGGPIEALDHPCTCRRVTCGLLERVAGNILDDFEVIHDGILRNDGGVMGESIDRWERYCSMQ